jgi:hypothetical protein
VVANYGTADFHYWSGLMEIKEQIIVLLEQIMNSREGCCGMHHIYTPQLNVDHIKDLYKRIKQPSNTQMQIDNASWSTAKYMCMKCGKLLLTGSCPHCD